MNCKEALIELRNIQLANKQLRRAEREMGANPDRADEIVEEHREIAEWVAEAQGRTSWHPAQWDQEPITV